MAVVIYHSNDSFLGLKFTGGRPSVDVFFVISGFYMTLILNNKYVGKGSYILFLSNRFLRLYPMYWVVLIVTMGVSAASYLINQHGAGRFDFYVDYHEDMSLGTALFLIMTNILMFGQDLVMFLGIDTQQGTLYFTSDYRETSPELNMFMLVPQAWSLSIELIFYMMAPYLVRRRIEIIIFLIAISLSIRLYLYFHLGFTYDPWSHMFFPSALILFLLGIISYKLYLLYEKKKITKSLRFFIILIFSLYFMSYQFISATIVSQEVKNWVLYLLACISIPPIFELTKTNYIDKRLGDYSYPIYIVHVFFVFCLDPWTFDHLKLHQFRAEATIMLTIMTSYFLVKYIADPIENFRQSRISANQPNPTQNIFLSAPD